MSIMKSTFIFEQGDRGWTESFIKENNSDDISVVQNAAILVAQKRALLLGAEGSIKAVRTSLELNAMGQPITGDALLNYVSIDGVQTQESDAPDTTLEVMCRTLNGAKRKVVFMRGIWDAVVTAGGDYDPTVANWQANFNSWAAALIGGSWGWWGSDVQATVQVLDYQQNAPTMQVIITVPVGTFVAPFPTRFHVRISGVNGKSVLNGSQIVETIDGSHCKLVKPLAVGPFVSTGKLVVYSQNRRQISTVEAIRIIERKAGAPF